ncbi:MAG: EamA family transporter [Cytophagales bacterium]
MGYLYIALTVLFSAYGQLILKWRLNQLGVVPQALKEKFIFLFLAVFDPYIFSGFVAAFLASLTWMAALTKFELSQAYPFTSMSFVVVLVASYFLLNEPITWAKIAGCGLIVAGLVLMSRG